MRPFLLIASSVVAAVSRWRRYRSLKTLDTPRTSDRGYGLSPCATGDATETLTMCDPAAVTRRVGNSTSTSHRVAHETEYGRRRGHGPPTAGATDCPAPDDCVRDDSAR